MGKVYKERRSSGYMQPFMETVLNREGIPHQWHFKDGVYFNRTPLSNREYAVVYKDAQCEAQRVQSETPEIPVLSLWRLKKESRTRHILDQFHTDAFFLLKEEEPTYMRLNKIHPVCSRKAECALVS